MDVHVHHDNDYDCDDGNAQQRRHVRHNSGHNCHDNVSTFSTSNEAEDNNGDPGDNRHSNDDAATTKQRQ